MKTYIQKFGLISLAIIFGINLISLAIFGTGEASYGIGEVIGYSTILIAELLILVAIAQYKRQLDGVISFGQCFKLGLGIATLGGIAFGIYNMVYVIWIDPLFNQRYFAYQEGLDMNAEDFAARYAAFAAEQGFFYQPHFRHC